MGNIKRSTNGPFAHSHEVDEVVAKLERLKVKVDRDTANLSKRMNEKVDRLDSDVKVLNLKHETMEQLLAIMASAHPQKATKFYGGVHTHIHDGAVARSQKAMEFHGGEHTHLYGQHARELVTKLKSARHSRSEKFKSQEDSDSDSDDDGYLS